MVTCVHPADNLKRAPLPHVRKCILIFLNVARDPAILDDNAKSSRRLNSLLCDLSGLLVDNGSMVIALGTCFIIGEYLTDRINTVF